MILPDIGKIDLPREITRSIDKVEYIPYNWQ
jgi:hypothetical protein